MEGVASVEKRDEEEGEDIRVNEDRENEDREESVRCLGFEMGDLGLVVFVVAVVVVVVVDEEKPELELELENLSPAPPPLSEIKGVDVKLSLPVPSVDFLALARALITALACSLSLIFDVFEVFEDVDGQVEVESVDTEDPDADVASGKSTAFAGADSLGDAFMEVEVKVEVRRRTAAVAVGVICRWKEVREVGGDAFAEPEPEPECECETQKTAEADDAGVDDVDDSAAAAAGERLGGKPQVQVRDGVGGDNDMNDGELWIALEPLEVLFVHKNRGNTPQVPDYPSRQNCPTTQSNKPDRIKLKDDEQGSLTGWPAPASKLM
ncbi:hypothetical protein CPB83DRAFT_831667 [Crepidotus variabilis]|uniref:Uncharacterized protein n=1 Tax=Crepidotus variabilis TaxID=179855 RepID=A0A9P6JU48_9AGAR|nr:hypothetical protein CPB83DRAFT_831667 [Crepidotus variabilis]